MKMSFRWYGNSDLIPLAYIRQIPGMKGIVSAIYDIDPGDVWPIDKIRGLKNEVEKAGLELTVIESVPVHEDIKLGLPSKENYIENYKQTIRNLAECGIETVCYNFMPVFDWTRSSLEHELSDGSTCLSYEEDVIERMDPLSGELSLPGWDSSYKKEDVERIFNLYASIDKEQLRLNLKDFLQQIIPVAEEEGVKLAVHPDDPPWDIFGLPRILSTKEDFDWLFSLSDSPSHGMCFCTGSLGPNLAKELPDLIRYFGSKGRIHFVHARNVKITGDKSFHESAHLSAEGSVDMFDVVQALHEIRYTGPIRPDHGRMIWGETGKPGYGLFDRALGAVYLNGLWEALQKKSKISVHQ
ncbi:mannonate dehydratase [Metabacillus sp. RGM 3146]|uniref:mannonate dehydratase n=1 Tax=Metabacillus sp. RGM 3146 TaxID=3401092 RepID=UPI003B9CF6AE